MPSSAPPPRRLINRLLVFGVALLAIAPAALWWVGHQATLRVTATSGIPQCQGTQLTTVDEPGSNFRRSAIPMSDGFTCTLTIKVTNRSDREVRVDKVTFPVGGPGAGASFQVTHIGDIAVPDNDQIDAVSEFRSSLQPGAEQLFDLRVAFRETGCDSEGSSTWVDPIIEVHDVLASHDLSVADLPGFAGTADSSCDT